MSLCPYFLISLFPYVLISLLYCYIFRCYISLYYNLLSTMPRVATASKQKNRKFKGSKRGNKKAYTSEKSKTKAAIGKSKAIKKLSKVQRIKDQKGKKSSQADRLAAANEYLDAQTKGHVTERIKLQSQMRIIMLLPCNQHADTSSLMQAFCKYLNQDTYILRTDLKGCLGFPAFQVFPGPNKSPIKNRLFVIASQRDPKKLIDLAKCADIVCPVVSVLSANAQKIVQDPLNFAGAFDEAGYTTINLLRSIGLPKVVGLIQHLDKIDPKNHDKISKFYKRFLSSEFGEQRYLSIQSQTDLSSLFRILDSCSLNNQPWKNQRGYLLADQVELGSDGNLIVSGFLKGNCINSNQLVHITGFNDYQIEKIEIQSMGSRGKLNMEIQEDLVQFSTIPEDLAEFSRPETNPLEEDITSALQGLKLEAEQQNEHLDKQVDHQSQGMEEQQSDNEQEWEDEDEDIEQTDNKADEKAKRVEMQMRKEDELEFDDEVEYATEEILRQKFREYQGLKSFKTSQWNQLQNLPKQYDRIFFFKRYNQTHQAALKDNLSRGFAYPGFYIRVTLKGFQVQKLENYILKMPLVLSFLLKHERKMTVLHGKVKRNPYYEGDDVSANSNQLVMISVGFKRILVNPIYSRCLNGTEKTKFARKIGDDNENYYYCSFYGHNQFPPSPFLIFRVNPLCPEQVEGAPMMRGQLIKCDPMHVILERIILTGYPFKINRRRSTVRFMFFNPQDVKYFRPVEVRSKMGLRGKIEESLGTHGFMKVLFNEQIKHDDTVCMHLYRRVYPPSSFC